MRKPWGLFVCMLVTIVLLAGCQQTSAAVVERVPLGLQPDIAASRGKPGAAVFADDTGIYLVVTVGEEQKASQHIRYLDKFDYDKADQTLTLYFEQYQPQKASPDSWYQVVRVKNTDASSIKVSIAGGQTYTVLVPK